MSQNKPEMAAISLLGAIGIVSGIAVFIVVIAIIVYFVTKPIEYEPTCVAEESLEYSNTAAGLQVVVHNLSGTERKWIWVVKENSSYTPYDYPNIEHLIPAGESVTLNVKCKPAFDLDILVSVEETQEPALVISMYRNSTWETTPSFIHADSGSERISSYVCKQATSTTAAIVRYIIEP
jgi:hypothetical protein